MNLCEELLIFHITGAIVKELEEANSCQVFWVWIFAVEAKKDLIWSFSVLNKNKLMANAQGYEEERRLEIAFCRQSHLLENEREILILFQISYSII